MAEPSEMTIEGTLRSEAAEYLESRGLDPELAVRFGLWSRRQSAGGECLIIPFYRNGEIVQRKYRVLPKEKQWQDKGGVKCFWNEDALRDTSLSTYPLIITEGEFDAMTAIQCGFPRTVSVPEGAPAKPIGDEETTKYDFLEAVRDELSMLRAPEIIIASDGDEAGGNLLHDLSLRLGRARCKYLVYPKARDPKARGRIRLKDLNEVFEEYGEKGVRETIANAKWVKVEGIYRMSELPPMPPPQVYDIDFPKLRENYKLRLGDFVVVTGIPSHGKTTWVNDLCCRMAMRHKLTVCHASFEQNPQRDHKRNLRTWFNRTQVMNQTEQELLEADQWIDRYFSFVVPSEDDDVTLDWMLEKLEAAVIRHDAKIVTIDPWNEMDHARERDETTTEYVGRAIKALKRFAKKLQVHLIVVAHPQKQRKNEDGKLAIPTLYDISDSAHWFNKADLGVVVHREDGVTTIRVAKSRYHDEIGVPGDQHALFLPESRRFDIIDKEAMAA